MKWLEDSIMMKRGVGADREPVEHHLTEEMQKTYHYTIGPYSQPVLHVKPGDRVVVETRDAFEGKIRRRRTSRRKCCRCRSSIRRTGRS